MFSPLGADRRKAAYLAGGFDYEKAAFEYNAYGDIDQGPDYYAPQTFTDERGRRVIIGWASDWRSYAPVQDEGWCGYFALPRRVEFAEDCRLRFIPIEALQALRYAPKQYAPFILKKGERRQIAAGDGISAEIIIHIDREQTGGSGLALDLRADGKGEERTRVTLDFCSGELVFDRSRSDSRGMERRRCTIDTGKKEPLLHIFLDTCSVELFTDDYRIALTGNIYSRPESGSIFIESLGGETRITGIETWGIAAPGEGKGGGASKGGVV
jgi:beta-fructofuranosidase